MFYCRSNSCAFIWVQRRRSFYSPIITFRSPRGEVNLLRKRVDVLSNYFSRFSKRFFGFSCKCIGSSICNINASIEYISAPMQIYNVVPVNFNIKNLKRYLMYFGVSTDSFVSFPFIADCQTNSGLAASVVLTATYFSVQLGPYGVIQLEDWIVAGNAYPGEPYGTLLSNVKIEQHEAEELSEKTIIALQINNAVLSNTTKARILAPDNHTITEGWYISYVFNSDSIPFDTAYAF